jgi:hypothetical protein
LLTSHTLRRRGAPLLAAVLTVSGLLLALPATGGATVNPNDYLCYGHISGGKAQSGVTGQQVAYVFECNGPITGYQIQSQLPISAFDQAPLVSDQTGAPITTDSFSCSGSFPGYAVNCVGSAANGLESISAQFAIETKLCTEPREDALLTVTYASVVKGVVTQAISGPFELGRPHGCPASPYGGQTRLTAYANGSKGPTPNKKKK